MALPFSVSTSNKEESQVLHHSTAFDAITAMDLGVSDSVVVSCYFELQFLDGVDVGSWCFLYSLIK